MAVCKRESQVVEELSIIGDEGQGACDGLGHSGIGQAFGHPCAVGFVGDLLATLRQVILAMGLLDVR